MEEQRKGVYRGFEMSSTVHGDPAAGFHVIAQRVQLTAPGTSVHVPIDDIAAARFVDIDSALVASFACIQAAIDRHIQGLEAR